MLFSHFIKSIDDPQKFIFVGFHSEAKKHLILALLSTVRRHHVQAGMNMRQVLEAGAWAAYAMAHAEVAKFAEQDAEGYLEIPRRLEKACNGWLTQNYETKSKEIERLKRIINESLAHSNILHAAGSATINDASDPGFDSPFFDAENDYQTRSGLWFIGNTAMGMTELLATINEKEKVFQVIDGFSEQISGLARESAQQKLEMMSRDEYKRASAKRAGS